MQYQCLMDKGSVAGPANSFPRNHSPGKTFRVNGGVATIR
jgi:hypothetical protein